MRALFAYDHRFLREGAAVYSARHFGYSSWARYLRHFDELTVTGRADRGASPESKANLSSGPRVDFVLLPDLAGLRALTTKRIAARRQLEAAMEGCDAVIARLPSQYGSMALRIARRRRLPAAVEIVGCPWDALWNYGDIRAKLYAPFAVAEMRHEAARADFAIYVTREFLERRYPHKPGAITASASNVEIPEVEHPARARERRANRTAGHRFIIGHIGSLTTRYKGLQTLIAALGRERASLPPFELRVLAPGDPEPWRQQVQSAGLDGCVRFDGVLPSGAPVREWLDQIDLYAQPSLQEGLPRALLEAMSRGCPALGSTAGGIPELLAPGSMHAPGDVTGLAQLLRRVVPDRAWQDDQVARNIAVAREYTSDILGARRAEFWSRFAASIPVQSERHASAGVF